MFRRLFAARQTQELIRFGTISFCLQVFFSIPRCDDDPDRVAVYAGPKTLSTVFNTFDGSVEFMHQGPPLLEPVAPPMLSMRRS